MVLCTYTVPAKCDRIVVDPNQLWRQVWGLIEHEDGSVEQHDGQLIEAADGNLFAAVDAPPVGVTAPAAPPTAEAKAKLP